VLTRLQTATPQTEQTNRVPPERLSTFLITRQSTGRFSIYKKHQVAETKSRAAAPTIIDSVGNEGEFMPFASNILRSVIVSPAAATSSGNLTFFHVNRIIPF